MKRCITLTLLIPSAFATVRGLRRKRDNMSYGPGQFDQYATDSDDDPFLVLTDPIYPETNPDTYGYFYLRPSDGLAYVENHEYGAVAMCKTTPGTFVQPGDCSQGNCHLAFQDDGNLVYYYNDQAIWDSGTGGSGAELVLSPEEPYVEIKDGGGNIIYYTSFMTPSNPGGGGSICGGPCPPGNVIP